MWLISHRCMHQYIGTLLYFFFCTHAYNYSRKGHWGGWIFALVWYNTDCIKYKLNCYQSVNLILLYYEWLLSNKIVLNSDIWVIINILLLKGCWKYFIVANYIHFVFQNKKKLQGFSELSMHFKTQYMQ